MSRTASGDVASTGVAAADRVRGLRPSRALLLAVSWLLVAVWLQLIRSSRVPLWDTLWAEDGRFFYGVARAGSLSTTVLQPLAGYLQVAPRLLASVAAQFPTTDAALAVSLLAATATAGLSLYVYAVTGRLVRRQWQRCLLAAVVVLNPAAGNEVNAAINNLHWYLILAAFWACWSRASSRPWIALDTVIVAVAALSDPLTGLLLPLAAVRARRNRSAQWTLVALLLALCMQYVLAVSVSPPARNGAPALGDLPLVYSLRIAGSALVGEHALPGLYHAYGKGFALVALLFVAALMALAVRVSRGTERLLLTTTVAYSAVFLVVPLALRGGGASYLRDPLRFVGGRYLILPLWLLYSSLILASVLPLRLPKRVPRVVRTSLLPGLVTVVLALQLAANFAPPGARTSGTSWRTTVAEARRACRSGLIRQPLPGPLPKIGRPELLTPTVVALPVAPYGRYFWAVRLRCSQL